MGECEDFDKTPHKIHLETLTDNVSDLEALLLKIVNIFID